MSAAALIAFFTAWASQSLSVCAPPPLITLRPPQEFRSPCKDAPQHPCNLMRYTLFTAYVDTGNQRDVYQFMLARDARSGIERGEKFLIDGHQTPQTPPLSAFLTNDQNGTLWPRQRPEVCDLPVLEGFDP